MNIYENVSKTVGSTPLVKFNRIVKDGSANIFGKLEFFNPTSSVKDRIAVEMIDTAEKDNLLKPGGLIIEPTSGNTGLGLAMVAASRGYKLIITMPESMSIERRSLIQHFGAEIILTPAKEGMKGAVQKAEELAEENKDSFMPQQFSNPANPNAHKKNTAFEIWDDTDGKIDIFIAGVGTGGTLTGVAQTLKQKNKNIRIVAIEPSTSAILSGEEARKHSIQGIGAGFVPDVLDCNLIDDIVKVSDQEAIEMSKKLAVKEGILSGISSGAAVFAAMKYAEKPQNSGKNIVVILPDTGERYLSTNLFL
ncbi:MAG: cysteine synthase A [Verrucomicrobiota bacterium]|nr:cysteine synthase A [Verrucomicrobiota bacterium]